MKPLPDFGNQFTRGFLGCTAEGDSAQKVAATWSLNWQGNKCNFLVTDGPVHAELHFQHNLLLLHLPKGKHRTKIGIWAGDPAYQPAIQSASGRAENLSALTKGGSAQWGDPIVTKGELSTDDQNAYVVDRIGIPFNNKYEPRMRIGAFDFFADGKSCSGLYLGWGCMDRSNMMINCRM